MRVAPATTLAVTVVVACFGGGARRRRRRHARGQRRCGAGGRQLVDGGVDRCRPGLWNDGDGAAPALGCRSDRGCFALVGGGFAVTALATEYQAFAASRGGASWPADLADWSGALADGVLAALVPLARMTPWRATHRRWWATVWWAATAAIAAVVATATDDVGPFGRLAGWIVAAAGTAAAIALGLRWWRQRTVDGDPLPRAGRSSVSSPPGWPSCRASSTRRAGCRGLRRPPPLARGDGAAAVGAVRSPPSGHLVVVPGVSHGRRVAAARRHPRHLHGCRGRARPAARRQRAHVAARRRDRRRRRVARTGSRPHPPPRRPPLYGERSDPLALVREVMQDVTSVADVDQLLPALVVSCERRCVSTTSESTSGSPGGRRAAATGPDRPHRARPGPSGRARRSARHRLEAGSSLRRATERVARRTSPTSPRSSAGCASPRPAPIEPGVVGAGGRTTSAAS